MHDLLQQFSRSVDRAVDSRNRLHYYPDGKRGNSPSEWRQQWVDVFLSLCEPLHAFVSEDGRKEPDGNRIAILTYFDRFCSQTSMNHLLDHPLSTYLILDCLYALSGLIETVVGARARSSVQFQRIRRQENTMVHILANSGFWSGTEMRRDECQKAISDVPFPADKYFAIWGWKRID